VPLSQDLTRITVAGLPPTAKSSLARWPKFEEACESKLKAASRAQPTRSYVDVAQVDAFVETLRERIKRRHWVLDEFQLWNDQRARVPEFERIERMEADIRAWQRLGWKIDDPAFQRRFLAQGTTRDVQAMQYYMQRGRSAGQSAGSQPVFVALRSNRDLLERWEFVLGSVSIEELRGQARQTRIQTLALRTLAQSGVGGVELKDLLRDLDEFSALTARCIETVPRFWDMTYQLSLKSPPPPNRTDESQLASRQLQMEAAQAARAELQRLHVPLTRRAIDATSGQFLLALKDTRKSHEVPLTLASFYGAGAMGTTALSDPAIAPHYYEQLTKLEAVERAAIQAELARQQAIEAKEAAARAKDLQRRIAANLAPTVAEVEALLIGMSGKKTAETYPIVEFIGRNQFATYGQFFGNRVKTNEYSLSISDLACRATGATQTCTWKETTNWTRFFLFENIVRPQGQTSDQNSGVFRWAQNGLVAAGEVEVSYLTRTSGSSGGSTGSSSSAGRSLQDQFMDRELDNRQNYLDRTQGMGSNAPSYNPGKRY